LILGGRTGEARDLTKSALGVALTDWHGGCVAFAFYHLKRKLPMANIDRLDFTPRNVSLHDVGDGPDAWLGARMEPDILMPSQFNDLARRRKCLEGETRLAFAVLEDAVRTYVKHLHAHPRPWRETEFNEVRAWFESTRVRSPFAFRNICEVLDLDADCLLKRLGTLRPGNLPQKQLRSVGRRHSVRALKDRKSNSAATSPRRAKAAAG